MNKRKNKRRPAYSSSDTFGGRLRLDGSGVAPIILLSIVHTAWSPLALAGIKEISINKSSIVVLALCLGSPNGVRPFLPLYPTRSMSAATFSLPPILLLLRLVPWGSTHP